MEARMRNVSHIAVCDHNVVQGTLEAMALAKDYGIHVTGGVEIDGIFHGKDMHILCYGADLRSADLRGRIEHARAMLDGMSTELLSRMRNDYTAVDMEEYIAYEHDTAVGGWKMLEYLREKKLTKELKDGLAFYDQYNVTYENAGFHAVEDIIRDIHAAGGYAVLAHPGVSIPFERISEFENELNAIMDCGVDGVECYYPRHERGITETCLRICRKRGSMITAGSDCHGAFNHNEIGCTKTPEENLVLKGL